MFYSYTQYLISQVNEKIIDEKTDKNVVKICTRCKVKLLDVSSYVSCFNCHISYYCSVTCQKKNLLVHDMICKQYYVNHDEIKFVMMSINKNFIEYNKLKKIKDKENKFYQDILNN